jgi:hypothetical protein
VQKRLLVRSWKVFAVFLCANISIHILGLGRGYWERLSSLSEVNVIIQEFLVRVPGDYVAFEILYLIAAFLLVAAIFIRFRVLKWLLGIIILLPLFVPGEALLFIALGCAGMLVGIYAQEDRLVYLVSLARRYLWGFPLLLLVNVFFLDSVSSWSVTNEARLFLLLFETVLWFYTFVWCIELIRNQWIKDQVIFLGYYTLPAYLFQMICAQVTYILLAQVGLRDFQYYLVSLVLVTVATWLGMLLIDRTRKRWRVVAFVYRLSFQ